jgi:ammonium transporter, Amt family
MSNHFHHSSITHHHLSVIGALVYWATGYAFGFGSNNNGFIGTNKFFLINTNAQEFPNFFYNFVFAVTSATILSGAVAERTRLIAYFSFTAVATGFMYPVVTHWAWSPNGWLTNLGFVVSSTNQKT